MCVLQVNSTSQLKLITFQALGSHLGKWLPYCMEQFCPRLSSCSSPGDDLKFPLTMPCPLTSGHSPILFSLPRILFSSSLATTTCPSSLCLDITSFRKPSLNTTQFQLPVVGLVTLSPKFPQGRCLPQVTLHHDHLDSCLSPCWTVSSLRAGTRADSPPCSKQPHRTWPKRSLRKC